MCLGACSSRCRCFRALTLHAAGSLSWQQQPQAASAAAVTQACAGCSAQLAGQSATPLCSTEMMTHGCGQSWQKHEGVLCLHLHTYRVCAARNDYGVLSALCAGVKRARGSLVATSCSISLSAHIARCWHTTGESTQSLFCRTQLLTDVALVDRLWSGCLSHRSAISGRCFLLECVV
jgi:hypothetical protein